MSNPKYERGARRKRNPLPVLGRLRVSREPAPCKDCGKEPRQGGSSRCAKCAQLPKVREALHQRIDRRIEEQSKNAQ